MQALRSTLLLLCLTSLYMNLGTVISGTYVGGIVATFFGTCLAVVHFIINGKLNPRKKLLTSIACATPWIATIFLSPNPTEFLTESTKSFLLLLSSIVASLGISLEFRHIDRKFAVRIFGTVALILIFLCYLEVYTSFKNISNEWRNFVFSNAFIYDAYERDIMLAGQVRPSLFTQEPSHVAKAISVTLGCWFVLTRNRARLIIVTVGFLAAAYVCRSPTLILTVGIVAAGMAFGSHNELGRLTFGKKAKQVAISTLPVVALFIAPTLAQFIPLERAQMVANGRDVSVVTRTQGPMLTAFNTAARYPLAGAGIGGRELVADILNESYASFPGYPRDRLKNNYGYTGWGNAFFEMLTYSGIVMTIILLPFMMRLLRQFHSDLLLSFTVFFLVFNFDGGFGGIRPWGYFAIITAAFCLRHAGRKAAPDRPSAPITREYPAARRRPAMGTRAGYRAGLSK